MSSTLYDVIPAGSDASSSTSLQYYANNFEVTPLKSTSNDYSAAEWRTLGASQQHSSSTSPVSSYQMLGQVQGYSQPPYSSLPQYPALQQALPSIDTLTASKSNRDVYNIYFDQRPVYRQVLQPHSAGNVNKPVAMTTTVPTTPAAATTGTTTAVDSRGLFAGSDFTRVVSDPAAAELLAELSPSDLDLCAAVMASDAELLGEVFTLSSPVAMAADNNAAAAASASASAVMNYPSLPASVAMSVLQLRYEVVERKFVNRIADMRATYQQRATNSALQLINNSATNQTSSADGELAKHVQDASQALDTLLNSEKGKRLVLCLKFFS